MSKVQQTKTTPKHPYQKSHFNQSVSLHPGQKYISNKIDPQLAIAFSIPQYDVVQLFKQIVTELKFELIQCEQTYATAIKKPNKINILQLLNCLSWWGSGQHVNAVKLTILNNPHSTDPTIKLCRVRALSQPTNEVLGFIQAFKEKMERIKGTVPSAYLLQPNQAAQQQNYQSNSNPFYQQACSYYMFHKILTCASGPEQKIHLNLQKSLKDFFEAFKNVQQSSNLLPTPIKNVMDIVEETCQQIAKLLIFKQAEENSKQAIMPFMKIAIQKYVFDRTQTVLKTMYLHRDRQISFDYKQKKQKILKSYTKQQIFQQVLLNKNLAAIQASPETTKIRGGIQFCAISCPQLQKISQTSSPRQKIKHCQLMYAQLKSYFYEKLNMKYELHTMQDIIPVFIIVMLYAELQDLRSQLNLMIDYISTSNEDFEAQKRLLTNLSESYNYIVRDWKLQF